MFLETVMCVLFNSV